MAESKLRTLSIDFAVHILNLVKFLKNQHEAIVSNQIGRAGTSIGANIHEAQYAHGLTGDNSAPLTSKSAVLSLPKGWQEKTLLQFFRV